MKKTQNLRKRERKKEKIGLQGPKGHESQNTKQFRKFAAIPPANLGPTLIYLS